MVGWALAALIPRLFFKTGSAWCGLCTQPEEVLCTLKYHTVWLKIKIGIMLSKVLVLQRVAGRGFSPHRDKPDCMSEECVSAQRFPADLETATANYST